MNSSDDVKTWHKAAPWLISAVTILCVIVILHH
jgi:hypothetical protein